MGIYVATLFALKSTRKGSYRSHCGVATKLIPAVSKDEAISEGMKEAHKKFLASDGYCYHECHAQLLAPMLDEINQEIGSG